jgi:hypothetical protein
MYEQLLAVVNDSAIGRGVATLLQPNGWPDNQSARNIVIVHWQRSADEFDLVVVNLAPHDSQCLVQLPVTGLASRQWHMRDLLSPEHYHRPGPDLAAQGLYFDLPAHRAQLFRFEPASA